MARTISTKYSHFCNCEYCDKRTSCFICGKPDGLQRAHIIPQRIINSILEDTEEKEEWLSFDGNNILSLCSVHHRLFDNYKLDHEGRRTIMPLVHEALAAFISFTSAKTTKKAGKRTIEVWTEKMNKFMFGGGEVIKFEFSYGDD